MPFGMNSASPAGTVSTNAACANKGCLRVGSSTVTALGVNVFSFPRGGLDVQTRLWRRTAFVFQSRTLTQPVGVRVAVQRGLRTRCAHHAFTAPRSALTLPSVYEGTPTIQPGRPDETARAETRTRRAAGGIRFTSPSSSRRRISGAMKSRITSPSAISVTLPVVSPSSPSPWPPNTPGHQPLACGGDIPPSRAISRAAPSRPTRRPVLDDRYFSSRTPRGTPRGRWRPRRRARPRAPGPDAPSTRGERRAERRAFFRFASRSAFVSSSRRAASALRSPSPRGGSRSRARRARSPGRARASPWRAPRARRVRVRRSSPSFRKSSLRRLRRGVGVILFSETRSDPAILDPSASTCERCQHSCGQFPWSSWRACASVAALA